MSSSVDALTAIHVRSAETADLSALTALWAKMYAYQQSCGMLGEMPADTATLWGKTIERSLGSRLAIILVAERGEAVVGFIEGVVTATPRHLGGDPVGVIRHLFVEESERQGGVGRQLVESAVEKFRSAGAKAIELQVVRGNESGERFWRELGWESQLVQLRRTI